VEFRVLGPLEMRVEGAPVSLGGAKQRAVLAVLLLRAGEVVPVGRLVDEVWGNDPPPSAAHSLESYVSRLRQLFNGHGPTLSRRGAGYLIELGDATLDARRFVEFQERALLAAAMDEHAEVLDLTGAALAMWRGPALADVALASAGRAEAERLEELRLRTHELRFDAELSLGRHEQAVGELQVLVGQNPYRERFIAQLMLALYRAGRQAEALDAYEQTRRRLDLDLGLQPSLELQQLSAQMVRQEAHLQHIAPSRKAPSPRPRRSPRMFELVAVGAAVAATMTLTASGGAPRPGGRAAEATGRERVALVLPSGTRYADLVPWSTQSFRAAGASFGFDTRVFAGMTSGLEDRIETGAFDLVMVVGQTATDAVRPVVEHVDKTAFVFLDASVADLSLAGAPNASAVRFADEQTSQLAGYLSSQVPRRSANGPVDMVSVVAGPESAHAQRVANGFRRGVERLRSRDVEVRIDYVNGSNLAECEQVANEQIDAGSDVVLVDAGRCGLGALAVARLRGVWGIGGYDGGVKPGPHVLAMFYKDFDRAIKWTLSDYAVDALLPGRDKVLGLNEDYAVGVDAGNLNSAIPESVWSSVVRLCSSIRRHTADPA
jgi:DNA-binding SARP family transcriptional activator/basic membrane lipoprotein Med (substrate-binding protein (PBP1-ABC) superfamily)